MQKPNPNDVRLTAMNLLARREHLRQELSTKLRKRYGTEMITEIESMLDDLDRENLLSDRRYVNAYIAGRSARGYGPERIRQELRHKGVDQDQIEMALDESEVDWRELAEGVRQKKFGSALPADFKEKARQLRFLTYRGFSAEVSSAALEDLQSATRN